MATLFFDHARSIASTRSFMLVLLQQRNFEWRFTWKNSQTTQAKYIQGFETRPSNPVVIIGKDGKYSFQHGSNSNFIGVSVSPKVVMFFIAAIIVIIPMILNALDLI